MKQLYSKRATASTLLDFNNSVPVTKTWGPSVPVQARNAIDAILAVSDDPIRASVFASCYAEVKQAKTVLYQWLWDKSVLRLPVDVEVERMQKMRAQANIISSMYLCDNAKFVRDLSVEDLPAEPDDDGQTWAIVTSYERISEVYSLLADNYADLMLVKKVIDAVFDMRG